MMLAAELWVQLVSENAICGLYEMAAAWVCVEAISIKKGACSATMFKRNAICL